MTAARPNRFDKSDHQSGAASTEYAIVVAVVAVVIVLALSEYNLTDAFTALTDHVKGLLP